MTEHASLTLEEWLEKQNIFQTSVIQITKKPEVVKVESLTPP